MGSGTRRSRTGRNVGRVVGMFLLPPAAVVVFLLLWGIFTVKVGLVAGAVVLLFWLILVVANIRSAIRGGRQLGHELIEEGKRQQDPSGTRDAGRNIVTDADVDNGYGSLRDRNVH